MPRPVVWRLFAVTAGRRWLQEFGMFSVFERSTGRWIGRIGAHHPEGRPGKEVGWSLLSDCWGEGCATEGAAAAADRAFDHLGWTEAVHTIDPLNIPSQAAARRLGSRIPRRSELSPPMNGKIVDVWGQTKEEWKARRR